MSTPIQAGSTDQRLRFVAVKDDWSTYKTDLEIADIQTFAVQRKGAADVDVSPNELDDEPDDTHVDGNIYNAGAGEYVASVSDAAVATGAPSAKIYGTWTDGGDSGYLIGDEYPLVNYDWQSLQYSGGANAVTITVKDDSDNLLENAVVELLSNNSIIDKQTTDENGVTSPTLTAPDGTYTRRVSVPTGGYSSDTDEAFAVSGATTETVVLTAHGPTPSAAGQVTGRGYVYVDGVATAGETVTIVGVRAPTSGTNSTGIVDKRNKSVTTDVNGMYQFTGLFPGVTYAVAAAGDVKETTIAADATGTVDLKTIVGSG